MTEKNTPPWFDALDHGSQKAINQIGGMMQLERPSSYPSLEHYLLDIYNRVATAKGLLRHTAGILGDK